MTLPKVIVKWEDICVMDVGPWVAKADEPYKWKPYICETVGFLLYDGPEGILVTDSVAAEHTGLRTQIPRGCIVSLVIETPKPRKAKRGGT